MEYRLFPGKGLMPPKTYAILGCPCTYFSSEAEARVTLQNIVTSGKGGYSVAINAEKIQRFEKDLELRSVIDNSILPVADGAGAVLGLRILHGLRSAKIDLPRALLDASNEAGWRLFVGGATEAVNAAAASAIALRYPRIKIVGRTSGFVDEAALLNAVQQANPQVMLLAMGSPRQELLASRILVKVPNIFIVGCGGALDIMAGIKRRAPAFMVNNNLEWLYRLYKEPSRWRRQIALLLYIKRLVRASIPYLNKSRI